MYPQKRCKGMAFRLNLQIFEGLFLLKQVNASFYELGQGFAFEESVL